MAVILSCLDLRFRFDDRPVLDKISFDVDQGRFCALLGRNGSGKTTLIHCLNRIFKVESGKIELEGRDLNSYSRNEIARRISLVPQEHLDVFPYRVLDVVVMGRAPFLKRTASPSSEDYQIAARALRSLKAEHLESKNFNRISGGERQIVLLARALAQTTRIMLLDEPSNHLDFNNQYHLLAAIKQLCRLKGISIVASMHDPNLASFFADQVVMIKQGAVMAKGPADTILTPEYISDLYEIPVNNVGMAGTRPLFFPDQITGDLDCR